MFISYGKLSSEFYMASKPIGQEISGDISYYMSRIPKDRSILEAGVGTGRLLLSFLENGYRIDGLDNSEYMLELCRQSLEENNLNTSLYLMDLEDFSKEDSYDTIIMPTGSFCLLKNPKKVLENFYRSLKKDGRIILDLYYPLDFKPGEITSRLCSVSSQEGILLTSYNMELDFIEQSSYSILKYEKFRQGKLIETELQDFKSYWYSLKEFKSLLEELGFHSISISSDYNYLEYPSASSQIISFEAKK